MHKYSQETPQAKLRNQLTPLYGLASMVMMKNDSDDPVVKHEMELIILDTAKQAIENKKRIDELLIEIDSLDALREENEKLKEKIAELKSGNNLGNYISVYTIL